MSNNEKFSRGAATVLLFVMIAAFVLAAFGVFSGDNSTSENNKPSISSVLESSSDGGTPPDTSTTPEVPDDSSSSVIEPPDDSSSGEVEGDPATSISLSYMGASPLNLFSTPERGAYYALETSKTYEFAIELDNASHSVSSSNLTVSLGGSGDLYFGTMQVTSDGLSQFTAMEQRSMSDMANKFIFVDIRNNTLILDTSAKTVESYYSSLDEDVNNPNSIYYDRYVYLDDTGLTGNMYTTDKYEENAVANYEAIPSCYFTVTVTDTVSGLSKSIRVWLGSAANKGLEYELNDDGNGYTCVGYHNGTSMYDGGQTLEITVPSSIDGLPVTGIGNGAFLNHSELMGITLEEGIVDIGSDAFSGCSGLMMFTIPRGVTFIGYAAFQYCDLSIIFIPKTVTEIGGYAFEYADVGYVYYEGSEAEWNEIGIWAGNSNLTNATFNYNYTSAWE